MSVSYELTGPIGSLAALGLVVLQTDETIEHDFRRIFTSPDIALYVTRLPMAAELTPDAITDMEAELGAAARLLPPEVAFDVVAYACTSGTSQIGAGAVADCLKATTSTREATNPLSAAKAALAHVGAKRVAVVSPYIKAISDGLCRALEGDGVQVGESVSFGERVEHHVARIAPASIHSAALAVGQSEEVDAVFLSCTNLRTLDIIEDLEAVLQKPVLSSNQALAWDMARRAKKSVPFGHAPGRLFHNIA